MSGVRRVLGWVLVAGAITGLFPLWPQVLAVYQGWVETPATDPALYRLSDGNSLVRCSLPSPLVLQAGTTSAGAYFECVNNYGAPVQLSWSVADAGGPDYLAVDAGSGATLPASGVASCQSVSLIAGATPESRTVVFRGATAGDSGFYVELYFTGAVTVQAGETGLGGGCP